LVLWLALAGTVVCFYWNILFWYIIYNWNWIHWLIWFYFLITKINKEALLLSIVYWYLSIRTCTDTVRIQNTKDKLCFRKRFHIELIMPNSICARNIWPQNLFSYVFEIFKKPTKKSWISTTQTQIFLAQGCEDLYTWVRKWD
jgi:hypothetical protein